MVGVYFQPNGKFYGMGGRSSDVAGSDFTHPFEYDPGSNSWATKSATYPDNQVNNMACGVLSDAGTPYIYCVGGSAAGATTSTDRLFRYDPVTDTLTTIAAPWPGAFQGEQPCLADFPCSTTNYISSADSLLALQLLSTRFGSLRPIPIRGCKE